MYTTIPKNPVGCSTYNGGYEICNNCVYRDDPLGCDGYVTENGAQVEYDGDRNV